MPDGSIVISTELDNKRLEKQLIKAKKEIERLEQGTTDQEAKKSPLIEQAGELEQRMRAAREEAKRYGAEWVAGVAGADRSQSAAIQRAAELEGQHAKVVEQIDKIDKKLQPAYEKLDKMKAAAGKMEKELAAASGASSLMGDAVKRAHKSLDRFNMRLREVVRSALIFTLITQSLAKFREWMGKVIESNAEASAAVAKLRGALLTMAQPLVGVIIPAFTALVNVLTRIITAIAQVLAVLFGGTVEQSKAAAEALREETDALGKTGAAAKKAGKQLAAFDEINKLSENSGGGSASNTPAFDFDTANVGADLDKLLNVVKLIGAALLAWKLTGSMKELFSKGGLMKLVGAFMTLDGAIGFMKETWDAWQNGVDWESFWGMIGRAGELVAGLLLVLGPTAAAIGLIVSGVVMLATAFNDVNANGWTLQNTLLAIAGIMAAGIGIAVLTGSFIPALIAAIGALLLAITTTFGDGEKLIEDAKQVLQGFLDFFVGVFTGDIDRALKGVGEVFSGLKGIANNVLDSIKNMVFSFLDWLDEKTGGKFSGIIQFAKDLIGGAIDWMKESFGAFANSFQQIFEGIVKFLSGVFSGDWDKAWEGLVDTGKGAVNLWTSMIESFVNFFINGLNALIKALNKISFNVPDWVPGIGGKHYGVNIPAIPKFTIPKLAAGAVIPPNREFMAVLGDQRSGNNIEAPENLIRKIVEEESGASAIVLELREILAAIQEGKVMMVDRRMLAKVIQETLSNTARSGGAAAVPMR